MNDKQKQILLKTAKQAIDQAILGNAQDAPEIKTDDPALTAKCGCFVTLKNKDELRGCLGHFTSDMPLIELVAQMAKASATEDPRFQSNPITADELDELDIEISVLSRLKRTDDPLSLRLGVDGIYIKRGWAAGCFLPQVATETGWTKEQFLSQCCSTKAGLPADSWKDGQTEVYLFTADIFNAPYRNI